MNFEGNLLVFNIAYTGPTGFDRMCGYVCKHAGTWSECLDQ